MRKNVRTFGFKPTLLAFAALLASVIAPSTALADFADIDGAWSAEPVGPVFVDADTRELITSEHPIPVRTGYEFGGYWSTPFEESGGARKYFDENLAMVGDSKWHELASGAKPLYAHWKYRIYLSTNAMDSNGSAVAASQAGRIDATSVPDGLLRIDDNGTPDEPGDDRTYIEAIDGAPIQLPRVTGRVGYLDSGAGTDGLAQVNARAWGVQPGAFGWATGIIPLDADGFTAGNPGELALDTANMAMTRTYDGSAYFRNRDRRNVAFPVPHPTTHSITLYLNWENRAKTYDVKLRSAYGRFTVSNAPTLGIKAVYDAPLLMERGGRAVAFADESARFFAPEKMTGEGSERVHEYLFKGFRTQPNDFDGMQGDELIGARIVRKDDDLRAEGVPVNAPFRMDAEAPELFAVWGRPRSTLTLDLNGGSLVGVIGKVVPVVEGARTFAFEPGAPVPNLPGPYGRVPVRPGYTFKGYYPAATGAGSAFGNCAEDGTNEPYFVAGTGAAANKAVPIERDWDFYTHTTLYAHWEYRIDFRLSHEMDCAGAAAGASHATMTLMSGPLAKDAPDRYGNRYPLEHAVVQAAESRLMAAALSGAKATCEGRHLLVTALAGVPVKVPVAQGGIARSDTWMWQVRQRDMAEGEPLATAKGNRSDGFFTSAAADGALRPAVPFPGLEPHVKTKTITAFAAWPD